MIMRWAAAAAAALAAVVVDHLCNIIATATWKIRHLSRKKSEFDVKWYNMELSYKAFLLET